MNITYKLNEDISRAKAMTEIQSTLSQHFPELVSLLLLKISRLFEFPWNDYGEQPFQIPFHMQIWYHQLILYFGAVGACLYATKEKSFIGFACMAAIMSHFIFLPFVAIPRYAFTAIPFLILFSAYLILEAVKYIQTNTMESALKLSLSLFISSGIALFILSQADILFQCLTLAIFICILSTLAIKMLITNVFTRRGYVVLGAVSLIFLSSITASVLMNSHDYPATVSTLKTSIEIKSKKPGWALLLLDSDNAIKNATIKFNDAAIGEKAKPLFLFPFENSISMLAFYNLYAGLTGTEKENFRQWRAVSIPVENINLNGANEIKISSSSPFQIYSEQGQPEGLEQIPSIKQISLQVIFLTNTQGKPDLRFPQKLSRKLSLRKSTVPGQPLILMVLGYNAASPGESKWEIF